ncbi:MAG: queuine tRNA-ribosyltransferase [Planctomycetota bacterium]|jgi:queuine tRNA-ribosyltransferase
MTGFSFRVHDRCPRTHARTGTFTTPHGDVQTPAFMPVGTRGTVKGVMPRDLKEAGSTMVLANAYHLHLRPGDDIVARLGGLHSFMNWDGPILTDSGGYQVFSMDDINTVDEDGVTFRSIVDGSPIRLTPEGVMDIERNLGADVIMAFDHVPKDPLDKAQVIDATDRTHRWLDRCVKRWRENGGSDGGQALFGIVQGGVFEATRKASLEAVCSHDLIGYAIGGVSVGEDREAMRDAVAMTAPYLPEDKPRYLMGIGTPLDFFDAVERGVDMFDCVTPTRHARNHQAYTSQGLVNLRNACWKEDPRPLDPECVFPPLAGYSRGVLRHLSVTNEMLAGMLLSLQNLWFFHDLMAQIRDAIRENRLPELRESVLGRVGRKLRPE